MTTLLEKRFHGFKTKITSACIEITGTDAETYLQGQTTNCVKTLANNSSQYNCLLNRQGRIEAFFVLTKINSNKFLLWATPETLSSTQKRLEDFIIADDVELKIIPSQSYNIYSHAECSSNLEKSFSYLYSRTFYNIELKRKIL